MVSNADKIGSQVTIKNDTRNTRVGKILRKLRLDEIPQLLNIITGDMTFVGTRPEVLKYVEKYTDEMRATLLLPAGVTSKASIQYKDEEKLLENAKDAEYTYINEVLPEKMKHNLKSIEDFSFFSDITTLFRTIGAVSSKKKIRKIVR
jgi:lipopolysaccharide/colanic/teichoic acid biosynthesis glycosyltransferase